MPGPTCQRVAIAYGTLWKAAHDLLDQLRAAGARCAASGEARALSTLLKKGPASAADLLARVEAGTLPVQPPPSPPGSEVEQLKAASLCLSSLKTTARAFLAQIDHAPPFEGAWTVPAAEVRQLVAEVAR